MRAKPLVAIALFITAILFAVACSSNNNLQDLKTGQLVGAAPWRQQVALLVGVAAATVTVPVVLNLLAAGLRLCRCRQSAHHCVPAAGGAAGQSDGGTGARRDRRQAQLEHDRDRRR